LNLRLGLTCTGALLAASVAAQGYPAKPIRFVVPQPPGGGADIVGRIVALKLQEALGQQVIVDNRSGAGGIVGTELVARAPADGYTLLLGYTGVLTINPSLHKQLPYKPLEDFAPVSVAAASPLILAVHPQQKINSVADLVTAAKARPAPLTYGSPGNGSLHHCAPSG
jgi:tripartite-type tricarboxylate transporter receptor subunit TctC